jgi:hypothetical protein
MGRKDDFFECQGFLSLLHTLKIRCGVAGESRPHITAQRKPRSTLDGGCTVFTKEMESIFPSPNDVVDILSHRNAGYVPP